MAVFLMLAAAFAMGRALHHLMLWIESLAPIEDDEDR